MPNASAVAVHQAVMEAGRQYGVVNAGYRAIDALSIEKGQMNKITVRQSTFNNLIDDCSYAYKIFPIGRKNVFSDTFNNLVDDPSYV